MAESLAWFKSAMSKAGYAEAAEPSQRAETPRRTAPPMLAPFLPDYAAFCSGYYRSCEGCPEYQRGRAMFCALWNRTYPEKAVELPFDMRAFLRAAERGQAAAYLRECEQRGARMAKNATEFQKRR